MNDRFLKRGHMYHSKMVLYIFQCTLVPEKNREIEKKLIFMKLHILKVFYEIT